MNILWRLLSFIFLKTRRIGWSSVYHSYRSKYKINKSFIFNGVDILFYGDGQILLSENSYIGAYSSIQASNGHTVTIGKRCMISHNVRIYTSTACADDDFTIAPPSTYSGDVTIGNGVWIGTNCYIGPGVCIGNNSVLGCNSVLTKSMPENQIWGGVPARLIRHKK